MRILCALTYYRPYTSGLTIYVERLATALVRRGHTVTVLTSQYDPSLPRQEEMEGVRVVHAPQHPAAVPGMREALPPTGFRFSSNEVFLRRRSARSELH